MVPLNESIVDPSYRKTIQNIEIFFQSDAYFLVSGFRKLTIGLAHTSYGDLLTIKEFDPSAN